MIVRQDEEGWLLISQSAHAWLAGELVAAWGNEQFRPPVPYVAVVLATRLHDIGWLEWDAQPRLDEDHRPVNFINTNLTETIPIWHRAVQWVSLIDPYAGLLVSKHASTIYRRRRERGADPPEEHARLVAAEAEQEAFQIKAMGQLADHPLYGPATDPDALYAAYRWLRTCDVIALVLCADIMAPSGQISAIPGGVPAEQTTIHYHRPEPFVVKLDPYPFAQPNIQLSIQTRYLPHPSFSDQAAFHNALEESSVLPQTVMITSG